MPGLGNLHESCFLAFPQLALKFTPTSGIKGSTQFPNLAMSDSILPFRSKASVICGSLVQSSIPTGIETPAKYNSCPA